MEDKEKEKWLLAGKIGKEARELGISLAKPGTSLLSIARTIENKITEAGGRPSFPPNLSVNQVAAHYTPKFNDTTTLKVGDILKVDVGASIDGFLSDTAATVVVGGEENVLVKATREALEDAIKIVNPGIRINEISQVIEKRIRSYSLSPIVNLGGHGLKRYEIHEGDFIPNATTNSSKILRSEGAIAIEPFATTGGGYVIDSSDVQILMFNGGKAPRSKLGRDILDFIKMEYHTLPFAKRWIMEKFGPFSELEIKNLVLSGALYEFNVLKEKDNGIVAQFEHTILFDKGEVTVTTL
ncbi:MAG: type II methionyl aminopeptidase [Candidatus Parvarchaeota archaeon]|nr:type II methionyl aminopeptidase [Candidatus Parvarchaeota archaeon]